MAGCGREETGSSTEESTEVRLQGFVDMSRGDSGVAYCDCDLMQI
jgi:hypothetical protein